MEVRRVRLFTTAWFARYCRSTGIRDESLRDALRRAERGQIDARLGGEVIKQRISRPGQGRSGGYRAIILFRPDVMAVCAFGYAKKDRAGLEPDELTQFKKMAAHVLALTEDQLTSLVTTGQFEEVSFGDGEVQE